MAQVSKVRFDRRGMVAALLMATALAGCGKSADAPAPTGEAAKIAAEKGIEKPNLKLGFIKLTDMAPLAIAKEKGFFAEEGLWNLAIHARAVAGIATNPAPVFETVECSESFPKDFRRRPSIFRRYAADTAGVASNNIGKK